MSTYAGQAASSSSATCPSGSSEDVSKQDVQEAWLALLARAHIYPRPQGSRF